MRSGDRPHWREVQERLRKEGVNPADAVVADWEYEGPHIYCGSIGTREGRLFRFCVIFGIDRDRQVTQIEVGYLQSWKEIPPEEVGTMPNGTPNSWLADKTTALVLFEAEESSS